MSIHPSSVLNIACPRCHVPRGTYCVGVSKQLISYGRPLDISKQHNERRHAWLRKQAIDRGGELTGLEKARAARDEQRAIKEALTEFKMRELRQLRVWLRDNATLFDL